MVHDKRAQSRGRRPGEPRWRLRPLCAALLLTGAWQAALGLPTGGQVVSGQVTIQKPDPNQLTITESSSSGIINWQGFSIGSGQLVRVLQPGTTATLLNRVVGVDPSLILGRLQANGQVFLINPRGIVFGAGSRIDAGSFVASTLAMRDQDFNSGKYALLAGSGTPGAIAANGVISAPGGTVVLLAPRLSVTGSIEAQRVGLAAAGSALVDVEGDGLVLFNVANSQDLDTRLDMLGRIQATGGTVDMRAQARAGFADTVLNMSGIVQARSIGTRNGQVVIDGGSTGITQVGGTIDVTGSAAGEHGGSARVLGDKVAVLAGASIDASGDAGGGDIRVGGDFHGTGSDRNASYTLVQSGAHLAADALSRGDGGTIAVWSNLGTGYYGGLSARGGAQGGNGGFAEVSGKASLDMQGGADLSAANGRFGTLLLDPTDIYISDGTGNNPPPNTTLTASTTGTTTLAFGAADVGTTGNNTLNNGAVGTLLGTTNLVLQANNSIFVDSAIAATAGATGTTPGSLTLQAGNAINVNANITTLGTSITLRAADPGGTPTGTPTGAINLGSGVQLSTGGGSGNISLTGTAITYAPTGTAPTLTAGGNVTLASNGGTVLALPDIVAGGNVVASSNGSNITQGTGTTITAGADGSSFTTLATGTSVNLGNVGNSFGTHTVSVNTSTANANNAAITSDSLTLAASTIGGSLTALTTAGSIGETGPLTTGAAGSHFTVPSGQNIILSGQPNSLAGSSTAGDTFTGEASLGLRDVNPIQLGSATLTGSLTAISNGAITQGAGSSLVVGTTTYLLANAIPTAPTGANARDIILANSGNTFGNGGANSVHFDGANVSLATTGALSSDGRYNGTLTELAGGDITETAAGIAYSGSGTSPNVNFTTTGFAGGVQINLGTSAANDFGQGTVTMNFAVGPVGARLALADSNAVYPTLVVPNGASGTVASAVLSDPNASVTVPALTLTGGGTNLANGTDALVVPSSRGITQSGVLSVAGTSSLAATGGAIVLGNSANTFGGNVALSGSSATVNATGNLNTSGTLSGALTETANGGAIGQGGALTVAGATTVTATSFVAANGGPITLGTPTGFSFTPGSVGVTYNGSAVSITSTGALNAGGTANTSLAETANGDIGQNGAITLGANLTTATFTNTSGTAGATINLSNAGNSFGGKALGLVYAGGPADARLAVADGGATFPTLNVSNAGGTLGSAVLAAPNGALALPALTLTGGAASLPNAGGPPTGGDTLAVSAGGAITQTGALVVQSGTSSFNAGTNAVTLTNAANQFAGNVGFAGSAVQISAAGNLSTSGTASSSLAETASGNIGEGPAGIQLGAGASGASFTSSSSAAGAAIGLDNGGTPNNAFNGVPVALVFSGAPTGARVGLSDTGATFPTLNVSGASGNLASLTLRDPNATVSIPAVTLTGASAGNPNVLGGPETLVASGLGITQAGPISVTGATSLNAGSGPITLTNPANQFSSNVAFTGGNVALTAAGGLQSSGSASGVLTEVAGNGAITQGGALTTATTASFTASGAGNDITLGGATTPYTPGGGVSFNGGNVTITTTGALASGGTAAGTLNETAGGAITQSAPLDVAGLTSVSAPGNDITLGAASGNTFTPGAAGVVYNGNNVSITSTGALAGSGTTTGALTEVAGGAITQNGALTVGTLATVNAGASDITLGGANAFTQGSGGVAFTGNNVNITSTGALASSGTTTGALAETAGGAITQNGAISVGTTTTLTATGNDVTLGGATAYTPGSGGVIFNARNVALTSTGALASSGTTSGNLSETAGGAITQNGALSVGGNTVVAAGANDITLGAASGNTFTPAGAVQFSGGNVSLTSTGALASGGSASGALTETAAGAISQSAPLTVGTTTTLAAPGSAITLGAGSGTFTPGSGDVIFNGTAVAITSTGGLTTQGTATTLSETASGPISQGAGALSVSGTSSFDANGNAINLGASQPFNPGGDVALRGGNVQLASAGALATSGTVAGSLFETANGPITQGGALSVGGTTSVNAGANAITLGGANAYTPGGNVVFNGSDVNITSTGSLTSVGTVTGTLTENAAGGNLNQAGDIMAQAVNLGASGTANLGNLTVSRGGQVTAGTIVLGGNLQVNGGVLGLNATAAPAGSGRGALTNALAQVPGQAGVPLTIAANTVQQNGGAITVVNGAELDVVASGGGSVSLTQPANSFQGLLTVLSGPAYNTAWVQRQQQSLIDLAGQQVQLGGSGIEGDIVRISTGVLGTSGAAAIVARLPYDSLEGTAGSEPGLLLTLPAGALAAGQSLGSGPSPIKIVLGSRTTGGRTSGPNSGYLTVLPRVPSQPPSAVFASGPAVGAGGGYQFFYDGAGKATFIPVLYNGLLPQTPQLRGALSSVAAVSEQARRDRFEETVRTENVAIRLRVGVISEVGPGRPATVGTEGAALPLVCQPSGVGLGCLAALGLPDGSGAMHGEDVGGRVRDSVIEEVGPGKPATSGEGGASAPEPCTPGEDKDSLKCEDRH